MSSLTNPPTVTFPCLVRDDQSLEVQVLDGTTQLTLAPSPTPTELMIAIDEDHSGTSLSIPDFVQDGIRFAMSAATVEGPQTDAWTHDGSAVAAMRIHGTESGLLREIQVTATPTAYVDPAGQPPLDTTPKTTTIRVRIHEKGIRPIP